ncbi:unnamed protein product [Closterium sp. NIES-65]|nr:unnamed protein product [Closterium sp. NIES-65]
MKARVVGVAAVEAVVEAVEALEVAVVEEGVVVGVEELVAAVVAAVGVVAAAVVMAVGVVAAAVVAVGVDPVIGEFLAVVRGSISSVSGRPLRPRSFVSSLLSMGAEGDCYLCMPPDPGIGAASLGASESTLPGIALA